MAAKLVYIAKSTRESGFSLRKKKKKNFLKTTKITPAIFSRHFIVLRLVLFLTEFERANNPISDHAEFLQK